MKKIIKRLIEEYHQFMNGIIDDEGEDYNKHVDVINSYAKIPVQNKEQLKKIVFERVFNSLNDFNDLDVSQVTDFSDIFNASRFKRMGEEESSLDQLQEIKVSDWDVSHGTNFDSMFANYQGIISDITNWDVHNGINFEQMFYKCTKFNQDISNWNINNGTSFGWMFAYCPEFNYPFDTINPDWDPEERCSCLKGMFFECASLTTAPNLPSTHLITGCYQLMFSKCTSLQEPPELPATALSTDCYRNMFDGCKSLQYAPKLPAQFLAENCYQMMFRGCESLTEMPELPAKSLAKSCYYEMFKDCKQLVKVHELPAIGLASNCYYKMFMNCESLTETPVDNAYRPYFNSHISMYQNCVNLEKAHCLFTIIDHKQYNYVKNIFKNAGTNKNSGVFIKHPLLNIEYGVRDALSIPNTWSIKNDTNVAYVVYK